MEDATKPTGGGCGKWDKELRGLSRNIEANTGKDLEKMRRESIPRKNSCL